MEPILRDAILDAQRQGGTLTKAQWAERGVATHQLTDMAAAGLIETNKKRWTVTRIGLMAAGYPMAGMKDAARIAKIRQFVEENNVTIGDFTLALSCNNTLADWKAIAEARAKYADGSDDDIEVDNGTITTATSPQKDPTTATEAASGRFVLMWGWVYDHE